MGLHRIGARLLAPVLARRPAAAARALLRFARAEQGSQLTLGWAARATPSVERRALYLKHAADEARHARMLSQRAAELIDAPGVGPVIADAEDLHAQLGELGMLAFLHRGERRARLELEGYGHAFRRAGDARSAAMFDAIVEDEKRHETYTLELAVGLAGVDGARAACRSAALWEAWRSFRRVGRAAAAQLYFVLMLIMVPFLLPMTLLLGWLRPARGGLHAPQKRSDSLPARSTTPGSV